MNIYSGFKMVCLVSMSDFSRSSEEHCITVLLTEIVQFSYYSLLLQFVFINNLYTTGVERDFLQCTLKRKVVL